MAIIPTQLGLGPDPFAANPGFTGPNGPGGYGPQTFATQGTAAAIAAQFGGTVVSGDGTSLLSAPDSPFHTNQAQYMIQMPNGQTIDPAAIAAIYQNSGGTLTAYDQARIQDILNGSDGSALNQPGFNGVNQAFPAGTPPHTGGGVGNNIGGYGVPANTPMKWVPNPAGGYMQVPADQPAPPTSSPTPPPAFNPFNVGTSYPTDSPYGGNTDGVVLPDPRSPHNPDQPRTQTPPPPPRQPSDPGSGSTPGDPTAPGGLTRGILPGGYGVSQPEPMPYGTGAIGGAPTTFNYKDSNNVGDILKNDRDYAYGQGGELIGNYGQGMAGYQQRARSLDAVGDAQYADLLQNPGYTAEQNAAINNTEGLNALDWTDQMGQSNFLTGDEQSAMTGDPHAGQKVYDGAAENLRQDARNYGSNVAGQYDNGATALNTATGAMSQRLDDAIDPSQLGLSQEYQDKYNFGADQQKDLENDAARTVGQGTAAVTDQLQRQANAAGTNAPLAMAAALDRQRQTGAAASADAMTKARIQAAQLGLQTEQQKENTRLQTAQDIASRRTNAATTAGQADIGNQQFLTSGRANAATTTGQAYLDQSNRIADTQTANATAADATSAQRAQALAQNRQTVNQANQAAQFSRGSYTDQAKSQRATQAAGAARADQTAGRQDIRQQSTTDLNQSNSYMAGQLQAFSGVTGSGQASQSSAIKAAQLPTTLDKVIGAGAAAASNLARGGVVDKPTVAHIGEDGPEIVIKLGGMNYKRRNEGAPAYA